LQALLRFRESASATARRVYFEAWSAAASILACRLRRALGTAGPASVGALLGLLGAAGAGAGAGDAAAAGAAGAAAGAAADGPAAAALHGAAAIDYFAALRDAVAGWADAVAVVVAGRSADGWRLADLALAYAQRVLRSDAGCHGHAPTRLLLLLLLLRSPAVHALLAQAALEPPPGVPVATRLSVLRRVRELVDLWQDTVAPAVPPPSPADPLPSLGSTRVALDSQEFADVDCADLMAVAMEAEELDRRASFAPIDRAILHAVHLLVPQLRRQILSGLSTAAAAHRRSPRALDHLVRLLCRLVAVCVAGGLRTWEGFLDEHGRDTLYLVPDLPGRRRVLVVFCLAIFDSLHSTAAVAGRAAETMQPGLVCLLADVWFECVCDASLYFYVRRLSALLHWAGLRQPNMGGALNVFSTLPPAVTTLVDGVNGCLKISPWGLPSEKGEGEGEGEGEGGADEVVALVAIVLRRMSAASSGPRPLQPVPPSLALVNIFSTWVARLLATLRHLQEYSSRLSFGFSDTRHVVDAMAGRIVICVRNHCSHLPLPPSLASL
ncbi:hypothetical protein LPJ66_010765, partial [Kickxella alabastrina]